MHKPSNRHKFNTRWRSGKHAATPIYNNYPIYNPGQKKNLVTTLVPTYYKYYLGGWRKWIVSMHSFSKQYTITCVYWRFHPIYRITTTKDSKVNLNIHCSQVRWLQRYCRKHESANNRIENGATVPVSTHNANDKQRFKKKFQLSPQADSDDTRKAIQCLYAYMYLKKRSIYI